MKVEAVQGNERRHSIFFPMAEGAVVGAAAGYVGKYALPLTPEEKQSDEFVKISRKVNSQKTVYNFRTDKFLNTLKTKENKTDAEKAFIGLFDGLKEGDRVKKSSLRNALKTLAEKKPDEVAVFKELCKKTSAVADKSAKLFMMAYDMVTRHTRPTGFFVASGAIVGTFIAIAHDLLKTNVKSN